MLGTPIGSFTQADLASGNVQYVHSSEAEKHSDAFSFTLSDGVNEVGEGLASLLDGSRFSTVSSEWRAQSRRCSKSFVLILRCPRAWTEAKRTPFWVPGQLVVPGAVRKTMQRALMFYLAGTLGGRGRETTGDPPKLFPRR